MLCRVAAVKSLSVHHYSAGYILFPLGSLSPILIIISKSNSAYAGAMGHIEGLAQDYGNSNIFLKPLFRGNLDPFVNNANLGAIAHTSNGT